MNNPNAPVATSAPASRVPEAARQPTIVSVVPPNIITPVPSKDTYIQMADATATEARALAPRYGVQFRHVAEMLDDPQRQISGNGFHARNVLPPETFRYVQESLRPRMGNLTTTQQEQLLDYVTFTALAQFAVVTHDAGSARWLSEFDAGVATPSSRLTSRQLTHEVTVNTFTGAPQQVSALNYLASMITRVQQGPAGTSTGAEQAYAHNRTALLHATQEASQIPVQTGARQADSRPNNAGPQAASAQTSREARSQAAQAGRNAPENQARTSQGQSANAPESRNTATASQTGRPQQGEQTPRRTAEEAGTRADFLAQERFHEYFERLEQLITQQQTNTELPILRQIVETQDAASINRIVRHLPPEVMRFISKQYNHLYTEGQEPTNRRDFVTAVAFAAAVRFSLQNPSFPIVRNLLNPRNTGHGDLPREALITANGESGAFSRAVIETLIGINPHINLNNGAARNQQAQVYWQALSRTLNRAQRVEPGTTAESRSNQTETNQPRAVEARPAQPARVTAADSVANRTLWGHFEDKVKQVWNSHNIRRMRLAMNGEYKIREDRAERLFVRGYNRMTAEGGIFGIGRGRYIAAKLDSVYTEPLRTFTNDLLKTKNQRRFVIHLEQTDCVVMRDPKSGDYQLLMPRKVKGNALKSLKIAAGVELGILLERNHDNRLTVRSHRVSDGEGWQRDNQDAYRYTFHCFRGFEENGYDKRHPSADSKHRRKLPAGIAYIQSLNPPSLGVMYQFDDIRPQYARDLRQT